MEFIPVPDFELRRALAIHAHKVMIVLRTMRPYTLEKLMDIADKLPDCRRGGRYYDVYWPEILEVTTVWVLDPENGGAAWKIYTYDTETEELKDWPIGTTFGSFNKNA